MYKNISQMCSLDQGSAQGTKKPVPGTTWNPHFSKAVSRWGNSRFVF